MPTDQIGDTTPAEDNSQVDSPTTETNPTPETVESKAPVKGKEQEVESQNIPYSRFKQKVEELKEYKGRLEEAYKALDYYAKQNPSTGKNAEAINMQKQQLADEIKAADPRIKFKEAYKDAGELFTDIEQALLVKMADDPQYQEAIYNLLVKKSEQLAGQQEQEVLKYQRILEDLKDDFGEDEEGWNKFLSFAKNRYEKGSKTGINDLYTIYKEELYHPEVKEKPAVEKISKGGKPLIGGKKLSDKAISKLSFDEIARLGR